MNKLKRVFGTQIVSQSCSQKISNIKDVILAFSSIQYHFVRDICANFVIPNLPQSPDIVQNSDGGISNFGISGQSLINKNCHNSRTSNHIDIKLGPVAKLNKRNKTTSQKLHNDVMSINCDVIIIFWIYGQFGAIRKPDSGRMVCNT